MDTWVSVPDHPGKLSIIGRQAFCGGAAQTSGRQLHHAADADGGHGGQIDAVVDRGPCQVGVEFTFWI